VSSRILGLDIRSHDVAAVVMHAGYRTERIASFCQVALTGEGEFEAQLTAAISGILNRLDVGDVFCQVALPSEWIVFRNISVPIKGHGKIRQILPYELEPSLAQPVETLTFDFDMLTAVETGTDSHLVVAGAESARLEACLNVLKNAKIDPDVITPGSCALAACLPKAVNLADRAVLVSMGSAMCDLYILISGQIGMVRTFRLPPDRESSAATIGTYLNQTLAAFEEKYDRSFDPQTLYLDQAVETDEPDVASALKQFLGCPVLPVDLAAASQTAIPPSGDKWYPHRFNNALALCFARAHRVKTFNLRQGDFGKRIFLSEQRASLINTAVLLGVAIVLGISALVLDGYLTQKKLALLDRRIVAVFKSTFPDVRRIVDPLQQMKVKIREQKQRISQTGGAERKSRMVDMLNDISRLIPKSVDVTLAGMRFGEDYMLLSGYAGQFKMVNDVRTDLEKADWVKTAVISSAKQDKSGQRVDFKIKLVFNKESVNPDTASENLVSSGK